MKSLKSLYICGLYPNRFIIWIIIISMNISVGYINMIKIQVEHICCLRKKKIQSKYIYDRWCAIQIISYNIVSLYLWCQCLSCSVLEMPQFIITVCTVSVYQFLHGLSLPVLRLSQFFSSQTVSIYQSWHHFSLLVLALFQLSVMSQSISKSIFFVFFSNNIVSVCKSWDCLSFFYSDTVTVYQSWQCPSFSVTAQSQFFS